MRYQSTRDKELRLTAAQAIVQGLSRDGGLYVPETVPVLPKDAIDRLKDMTYQQRAVYVMSLFLEDFSEEELRSFADDAYSDKYDSVDIAPVYTAVDGTHFLELWHGPTCAFKDMALQMLPHLLTASLKKTDEQRTACILVATSGDTGKAALEGFCDVPGTKIMVFFPKDGVSDIQALQMTTQSGENVGVCSVVGNFDDAQTGVKRIFSDADIREELSGRGYFLSSANSINWGRLLPQVVYYISAYAELVKKGAIKNGEEINFCVPTGNFGNILAGFYAKSMGLPVKKLICASNANDVLTDFISTGVYDRNREFFTTISPSMDILVSSNLERLLFELSGKDDALINEYMSLLGTVGRYAVSDEIGTAVKSVFECGSASEEQTRATIRRAYEDMGYLMDTHTAVAYNVLCRYRKTSGDTAPAVVVSTASPYKFCSAVLDALGEHSGGHGFDQIDRLFAKTGVKVPEPLMALRDRQVRFDMCVDRTEMADVVRVFLK